ncbi:hypothetical protein U9M48_014679 [Paspalum notatum var. saurae]|uniref:Pentatricopeptide repeat-containing protein n=1 Tax=Paspalum notatum var. saurae TaxID=547442 RepID=A0AAQ3T338_PASNO
MQRILSRTARRCTNSSLTSVSPHVQANAASRIHSDDAPTCSNKYGAFKRRTTLVRSMQSDIVSALHRGDRQRASLILSNFHHTKEALINILKYCAEAPDPLFAMETLELMEEKAIGMSKVMYRYVIRALSRGGYAKEALHWLTLLGEKESTHATLPFFNIFLNACENSASLKYVECCLEIMENHLCGKSEITYCELLKLAVLQGNLPAAYDIWKDCTRYYSPSIIAQRNFLRALVKLGDLQSANHILQHMVAFAAQRSEYLRVSSKGRYQTDLPVPALRESDDSKLFLGYNFPSPQVKLFEEKSQSGNNPAYKVEVDGSVANPLRFTPRRVGNILRWSFNDVMLGCVQFNHCQLAEQLFVEMLKLGLQPSKFTYNAVVSAAIARKGIADAIKMIEVMERRGIKPDNSTLSDLSVGCSKCLQLDLAEFFLEKISQIQPKHTHAFNSLLSGCQIMNEPERAVRILGKMKRVNLKPTLRTYELLFSLFGNVNVPYEEGNVLSHVDVSKRISIIEMDMLNNELGHSFLSLKNLIQAFGAEGMIEEMLRYLNLAENVLWNMNPYQKSDLYRIVLHALVDTREVVLARNDFEGALDLLDICKTEGIRHDIHIFNAVLRRAYARGQIHVIEYIVECMHRAKIQPDPATVSYTFCVYEEHELYNTAIEALQVLSIRMISEDASILSERRIVYEDLILSEEPDAELRIISAFEPAEEFLATALLNLRWEANGGRTESFSLLIEITIGYACLFVTTRREAWSLNMQLLINCFCKGPVALLNIFAVAKIKSHASGTGTITYKKWKRFGRCSKSRLEKDFEGKGGEISDITNCLIDLPRGLQVAVSPPPLPLSPLRVSPPLSAPSSLPLERRDAMK